MPRTKSNVEKYVLNRTLHLGFIKETFYKGTVFEVDRVKKTLETDSGDRFDNIKDVDICIRNGFFEPYTKTKETKLIREKKEEEELKGIECSKKKEKPLEIKVIREDADLVREAIDISWTKSHRPEAKEKNPNLTVVRASEEEENIRGIAVNRGNSGKRIIKIENGKAEEPVEKVDKDGLIIKTTVGGKKTETKKATEASKKAAEARKAQRVADAEKKRQEAMDAELTNVNPVEEKPVAKTPKKTTAKKKSTSTKRKPRAKKATPAK